MLSLAVASGIAAEAITLCKLPKLMGYKLRATVTPQFSGMLYMEKMDFRAVMMLDDVVTLSRMTSGYLE